MADGAGVVLVHNNGGIIRVLAGLESRYLTDLIQEIDLDNNGRIRQIVELERGSPILGQARVDFAHRAQRLSARRGETIQFSQPTLENGIYTTKYRVSTGRFGIPKGRREGQETPLANAIREVREEVGINVFLNDGDRQPDVAGPGGSVYAIFRRQVGNADAAGIVQRFGQRAVEGYGEMFDINFYTPDEILAGNPNMITRNALNQLPGANFIPLMPGGKRRRTRKLRKHAKKTLRRKSRA
jgi:8-oxo-dGTP pyrophosphatase MutT (NUDIX family)